MSQQKNNSTPIPLNQILCNHLIAQGDGEFLKKKKVVKGVAKIHFNGLTGDDGDTEYYKDTDKAILHYAFDHYSHWKNQSPEKALLLEQPGIFSENFSTVGITEKEICIGDIFKVGGALIQVTEGRVACKTMNQRFDDPEMNYKMHHQARTGWFYRVLEEGEVSPRDHLLLQERQYPEWTVARVLQCIYGGELDPAVLEPLSNLPPLAKDWKELITKRLQSGVIDS